MARRQARPCAALLAWTSPKHCFIREFRAPDAPALNPECPLRPNQLDARQKYAIIGVRNCGGRLLKGGGAACC